MLIIRAQNCSNPFHSYSVQCDRYNNEINIARHYANQKVWPRALFIRRARYGFRVYK